MNIDTHKSVRQTSTRLKRFFYCSSSPCSVLWVDFDSSVCVAVLCVYLTVSLPVHKTEGDLLHLGQASIEKFCKQAQLFRQVHTPTTSVNFGRAT
jgi:hypothetical protein